MGCFSPNPNGDLISIKLRDSGRSAPLDGEGGGTDVLSVERDVVRSQGYSSILGSCWFRDMALGHCLNTGKQIKGEAVTLFKKFRSI